MHFYNFDIKQYNWHIRYLYSLSIRPVYFTLFIGHNRIFSFRRVSQVIYAKYLELKDGLEFQNISLDRAMIPTRL